MSTRKLVVIYILLVHVFALAAIWISAGYPGYLNTNIDGGVNRLARIDCFSHTQPNCPGFQPTDANYQLLLGDSEAISVSDIFMNEFHPNGHVSAQTGCSFLPARIIRESQNLACKKLNSRNMKLLNSDLCGDIYIFNRFTPRNSVEEKNYLDFLESIEKSCNSLTVIGSPIEIKMPFSAYATLFFKSTLNTPNTFQKNDFDEKSLSWNARFAAILSNKTSGTTYIDTNSIIVPKYPTTLRNPVGEYYYFDPTHLSLYGGKKIFEYISSAQTGRRD